MDAKAFVESVGGGVSAEFSSDKNLLSYQEYLDLFIKAPLQQARNAAQYLRDAMNHYGTDIVAHPSGPIRRFRLFDLVDHDREVRVAGQEEVQNAIYRVLDNFVKAGRINKLILLHGPNGSAKSSIVNALKRALERYSKEPIGALYKINWIFPSSKLVKGSIGFSEMANSSDNLATYAHLEPDQVDLRLSCEMRDHPLFLVPPAERKNWLNSQPAVRAQSSSDFVLSNYVGDGELCNKCRQIYVALLAAYHGDYLKMLRHVQIERFHISRRYQIGTVTVEPQLSVDAGHHQVTADRSQANMPSALHNVALYEPHGALVSANRGLIEYSDLLKRPLEAYKYLLGASETAEVPLEHFFLQLDQVLLASSNEKHLSAFKELQDFASFKGRIELIRVPYLRRYRAEQQIYDSQITASQLGKHIAPHATEVAALWAVLTRLKKPTADRYGTEIRAVIDHLSPMEKLRLYEEGRPPDQLSQSHAKELKKNISELYRESDAYPNYEGRSGASAREIKTALFNAAQNPHYKCLTPHAVIEELRAICQDKSVYEFLQQDVVGGFHNQGEFVSQVEAQYLEQVDEEVRTSMGLISEEQYGEIFERYVQNVLHWVRGERMRNRITGEMEKPDDARMNEMEAFVMLQGEDSSVFRRGLISQIGAHKLDYPDAQLDYRQIFPDLFRRIRVHFFEERKRTLQKNKQNILRYLSEDRAGLQSRERSEVENTLKTMIEIYGYCENCAKDVVLLLMQKRYAV